MPETVLSVKLTGPKSTQVLAKPVSMTRPRVCEQKDTWATQNASSLMADPLEAPSDMTSDLTLYAAKPHSTMALARIAIETARTRKVGMRNMTSTTLLRGADSSEAGTKNTQRTVLLFPRLIGTYRAKLKLRGLGKSMKRKERRVDINNLRQVQNSDPLSPGRHDMQLQGL